MRWALLVMAAALGEPAEVARYEVRGGAPAEIHLGRRDRAAGAGDLQAFLQVPSDSPEAGKARDKLPQLRVAADPVQEFAGTGMATSFGEKPELTPFDGDGYRILRKDGQSILQTRDGEGRWRSSAIDAAIGSGRHARILLSRTAGGGFIELPLAWYGEDGGRYGASPGFGFSASCLGCHAIRAGDHAQALGCASCHATAASGKPGQAICLQCHTDSGNSAHGSGALDAKVAGDDKFELNSAGYRLLQSRCYRGSAGKLTCITCHQPHRFTKTLAEFRMVCRSCHPTMHNGAPLDCTRCHMPKRQARDAARMMVTDHRIQRPL
jgi:hypothetical protein